MGSNYGLRFPFLVDAAAGDDRFAEQWKPIRYLLNSVGQPDGAAVVRAQARDACVAMGRILRALPDLVGVSQASLLDGFEPTHSTADDTETSKFARQWAEWNSFFYNIALRPQLNYLDETEARALAKQFHETLTALDEVVWTRLAYWNDHARGLAEERGWLN